ncbi:MAG TPA: WD40 repeat domain-containing protein [Chthonomonadaceae bacterium]|nr:WD40 repeat domain-containing protein [Chthonomonadaceae bacterium]
MSHGFRSLIRVGSALALLALCLGAAGLAALPVRADTAITAGADKKLKIWNIADGTVTKTIEAHDGAANAAVLSPDGKLLATGGADKKIKLWNPTDGTLIQTLDAHDGAVTSLFFLPDNSKLLSGGADKKVKVWKVENGKLQEKPLVAVEAHEGSVIGLFGTADMIISGGADGMMTVWDAAGNPTISFPTEHEGGLTSMTPHPKERMLYTGGKDGKIKYWSQAAQGTFEGAQGSAVTALAVLPDGKNSSPAGPTARSKSGTPTRTSC